jgi:hypothetical protein
MDKRQKIERKIQRRLKNRMKNTKLNVETLRREICGYRFYFPNQKPWNQSFIPREHNDIIVRTKDQQHGSPEIKT